MKTLMISSLLSIISSFCLAANPTEDQKIRKTKLNLISVRNALNLYEVDCKRLPTKLEGLLKDTKECFNWGPHPYLKRKEQLFDAWGRTLIYELHDTKFSLKSLGHDGAEGGEGVDMDIQIEGL